MKKKIIAILMSAVLCCTLMVPIFANAEVSQGIEDVTGEDVPTTETTTVAPETTTAAPETTTAAEEGGFEFSIEDLLNSEIILGIMGSDGFMDITNIVVTLIATMNPDNLKGMAKEEAQNLVQSTFDSVADIIMQMYGNMDLVISYDPLEVMGNLFDFDDEALTTQSPEDTTKHPDELEIGLGDVDGDGKITAADARLILRRAAQLVVFTAAQDALADVDKDGKVTAKDARIVLRVSAGLQTL